MYIFFLAPPAYYNLGNPVFSCPPSVLDENKLSTQGWLFIFSHVLEILIAIFWYLNALSQALNSNS